MRRQIPVVLAILSVVCLGLSTRAIAQYQFQSAFGSAGSQCSCTAKT